MSARWLKIGDTSNRSFGLMIVYVVQHTHLINTDEEDTKFIGVYSSYQNADRAI